MSELLRQIAAQAGRTPDAPAYRNLEETVPYGVLWASVGRLANALDSLLGESRAPVAVYGHKSVWMPVCFLACARSGRPYLPIDSSCPAPRAAEILSSSGAALTLAAQPCPWDAKDAAALAEQYSEEYAGRDAGPDALFYLIYTSGSEGRPKGVRITGTNLDAFVPWAAGLAEAPAGVWLNQAPYSFDLSVMALYPALASGGCIYDLDAGAEFSTLFESLSNSGATTWVSTPSFVEYCLADKGFRQDLLPKLNTFLFCGETLRPETGCALFDRFSARIINTYGPTEATVAVSAVEITKALCGQQLPVGRARPGVEITVVDAQRRPLPDGMQGEVALAGNCVCAGYADGRGSEKFGTTESGRVYYTGDLGRIEGGMLYCEGRLDAQVKCHGYRIEPAEIEAALLKTEGVTGCAVLAYAQAGRTELAAFAAGTSGTLELRRSLRKQLPAYMIPRRILTLEELPLTSSGKLDRARLKELL